MPTSRTARFRWRPRGPKSTRRGRRAGEGDTVDFADPNAGPFCERMGARLLRNVPFDAISGRSLPLYEYDLSSQG